MLGAAAMINQVQSRLPVFFDTDCLVCFLWTDNLLVLRDLFGGRIRIPEEVVIEIMRRRRRSPGVSRVAMAQTNLKQFISTGKAEKVFIFPGSKQHDEFNRLVSGGFGGKILGRGESAAMVHARFEGGIVASNNLSDVKPYCELHRLPTTTATQIMVDAVSLDRLTFEKADQIWRQMIEEDRWMPYPDFQSAWDDEFLAKQEIASTVDSVETDD